MNGSTRSDPDELSIGMLSAIGDAMRALAVAAGVPEKHQRFAVPFLVGVAAPLPPPDLVADCRKVISASRGLLDPSLAAVEMSEIAASEPPATLRPAAAEPGKNVGRKARAVPASTESDLLLALRECLGSWTAAAICPQPTRSCAPMRPRLRCLGLTGFRHIKRWSGATATASCPA